jgi:hypothetical protein
MRPENSADGADHGDRGMGIEEDVGQGGAQPARKIKNDKADRTKIVLDVIAEDPREDECDQVSVRGRTYGVFFNSFSSFSRSTCRFLASSYFEPY